jgi:hypothetical protein
MKRFLFISLLLILFHACGLDDNGVDYSLELLPVESVDMPEAFVRGETYPITVTYFKPSTCYTFKEFYYLKENNENTVAVINYLYKNNNCIALDNELVEATFNFEVTDNGSCIFKFWKGVNDHDEDLYLTMEVPVTN